MRTRLLLVLAVGCSSSSMTPADSSASADASAPSDAGAPADAGLPDAGAEDAARPDAQVDPPHQLALNDVSFLFPLPADPSGRDALLSVTDPSHPRGALLPGALTAQLPALLSTFPQSDLDDLRVVAVRVDHCFLGEPEGACRRQLRLVAQPLLSADATKAVDASAHFFYDLDEDRFAALVERLRALRVLADGRTDGRPLGVHPVMAEEGLDGAYAVELKQLIREFCGADNLTRVALMRLLRPGSAWRFEAFEVAGAQLAADVIPRIEPEIAQDFSISDTAIDTGFLSPAPPESALPLLLDRARLGAATISEVEMAVIETHRIENPTLEAPSTIDCVSCHVADRARNQAREVRGVTRDDASERYSNDAFDLSRLDDRAGIDSQRAFGYFESTPSLIQRVVNESAEVARALDGL